MTELTISSEDERRWLAGTDPVELLTMRHPLRTLGSTEPQRRRSRVYLLACARRAWARLPDVCRALVCLGEIYADNARYEHDLGSAVAPVAWELMNSEGAPDDLRRAEADLARAASGPVPFGAEAMELLARGGRYRSGPGVAHPPIAPHEWRGLAALVYLPFDTHTPTFTWVPRHYHSLRLVREVYGNPYRALNFSPEWRTDTALSLARQMYEAREFSAMPILADALQDAGCNNEEVLRHCRDTNQAHVRGCWVVDLVLNRK